MRMAYADPPYLSSARLYKADPRWPEYAHLDGHLALIQKLCGSYDAFALSMSSVEISVMAPLLPPDVRWGSWCKSFASFKPNVNPAYCWEPVAFVGGRNLGRKADTIRDFIVCPITVKKGLTGAKPPAVCSWILDMLGFDPTQDTIDDPFPGTGAFTLAIADRVSRSFNEQLRLIP